MATLPDSIVDYSPWAVIPVVLATLATFIRTTRRDNNASQNSVVDQWKTIALAENSARILAESQRDDYIERERSVSIENVRLIEINRNLRETVERLQREIACLTPARAHRGRGKPPDNGNNKPDDTPRG